MNKSPIITFLLATILCVDVGHGLSCYQHDYCLGGFPTLSSSIVQCESNQSQCWKLSSPLGTKRGCSDNRCRIQLDTGIFGTGSVCCSTDLCNSSIQMKTTTIGVIFVSLVAFIYSWCM